MMTKQARSWLTMIGAIMHAAHLRFRAGADAQLVEKLAAISVSEDERNLRNKVSRGKFTAAFMLQCLSALGARSLSVSG